MGFDFYVCVCHTQTHRQILAEKECEKQRERVNRMPKNVLSPAWISDCSKFHFMCSDRKIIGQSVSFSLSVIFPSQRKMRKLWNRISLAVSIFQLWKKPMQKGNAQLLQKFRESIRSWIHWCCEIEWKANGLNASSCYSNANLFHIYNTYINGCNCCKPMTASSSNLQLILNWYSS